MKKVIASLHKGTGPGLDIRVGDTVFENVTSVPLAEQVSFLVSGDAGFELDEKVIISNDLHDRLINLLNGEDCE